MVGFNNSGKEDGTETDLQPKELDLSHRRGAQARGRDIRLDRGYEWLGTSKGGPLSGSVGTSSKLPGVKLACVLDSQALWSFLDQLFPKNWSLKLSCLLLRLTANGERPPASSHPSMQPPLPLLRGPVETQD